MSDKLPIRQLLAGGATIPIFVESESMSPFLHAGDKLLLQAATVDELHIGDIITLEQSDHLLTHRFYGMKAGLLQTRGDRNLAMDPSQPPSRLLGKIVARETLPLTNWRSRHIAWLARAEWRLLAHQREAISPTLLARGVHRLFYLWMAIVG